MGETSIKYPIIIYPCEEGGFVAEVPALKGCLAQGETIGECLAELEKVMQLWIETAQRHNQPLPSVDTVMTKLRSFITES